jgi:uncharacterized membrane protein YfcA
MGIDELTILQWILAGASALLVGLSKAGFGTGAAILAVPLMATILDPADMLPVMLLVLISGDVLTLPHYVRSRDRRSLATLVPGMLAGIVLGALALDGFLALPGSRVWMRRMIGGVSVAFVLLQLYRMARENQLGSPIQPYRPRVWHGVSIGALAGAASTLAHAGGPLVALFLLPQKLDRRVFVGTLVRFFFVANVVKLVPYARQGLMTSSRCLLGLLLLPCVVGGSLVGAWMNRRFSDRAFRLAVYGLAFAVGMHLLLNSGEEQGGREPAGREPAGQAALFAAGLRVEYNLGNCAYRSGRHEPPGLRYERTAQRCRSHLAGEGLAGSAYSSSAPRGPVVNWKFVPMNVSTPQASTSINGLAASQPNESLTNLALSDIRWARRPQHAREPSDPSIDVDKMAIGRTWTMAAKASPNPARKTTMPTTVV